MAAKNLKSPGIPRPVSSGMFDSGCCLFISFCSLREDPVAAPDLTGAALDAVKLQDEVKALRSQVFLLRLHYGGSRAYLKDVVQACNTRIIAAIPHYVFCTAGHIC